jgi:5-methylcytosine-specific restriction endonuclease McrA
MNKPKKKNRHKLEKELDKEWSLYVRKRDKFCQKCGGISGIAPHHAFGRRHLATRWDIFNGVGLCYPCHIHWSHRDPSGFSEWFRKHIGQAQFERLSESHNQVVKHTIEDLEAMLKTIKELE